MVDPKDELMRRAEERRRVAEQLQSQAEALEQAAADLGETEDAEAPKRLGRRQ